MHILHIKKYSVYTHLIGTKRVMHQCFNSGHEGRIIGREVSPRHLGNTTVDACVGTFRVRYDKIEYAYNII